MFQIHLASRVEREFKELSGDLKQKFYEEFRKLPADPFRHPKVKKIGGTEFGYRLRFRRWRILFALFSKEKRIEIVDIFLKKSKKDYLKRKKLL